MGNLASRAGDPMQVPFYVVVGHVTADLAPSGITPGGTALYGALTALRQGITVGVVTSVPLAYLPRVQNALAGALIANVPADAPSTFENVYRDGRRTQFLRARARSLTLDDVPPSWRGASIVHLGPIADETDPAIGRAFPQAVQIATPQGWLRTWDEHDRISAITGDAAAQRMPEVDILVFSEEDVAYDEDVIAACRRRAPLVAVTRGRNGSSLFVQQPLPPAIARHLTRPIRAAEYRFLAQPATEVDPTGAGDVYATSLAIALARTGDLDYAGRWASVAASFVVEGPGPAAIPTSEQIEQRLATYEQNENDYAETLPA